MLRASCAASHRSCSEAGGDKDDFIQRLRLIQLRRPHQPGRSRLDALFPCLLLVVIAGPVALLWDRPVVAAMRDSQDYLAFCAECTATYPLFLDAVAALFGTVEAVPNSQLVLAAAALAFCGFAVRRAFDAPLAALILVAFLGGWPHLAWMHARVMTESLFISCICVLVGFLALLLRRPAWWTAAAVSGACGLAITVRPAGVSLVPLLVGALWLIWRQCAGRRWVVVAALILPAALCIWGESAIWQAHHDKAPRPNAIIRNLFGKMLLIPSVPTAKNAELAQAIAHGRELMAPGRALLENAPSRQAKVFLLRELQLAVLRDDGALARAIASPSQRSVADVRGRRPLEDRAFEQSRRRYLTLLDTLGDASREALMANPASWLRHALTEYWGQWSWFWLFSPSAESGYRNYAESLASQPLFAGRLASPFELYDPSSKRHWRLPMTLFDSVSRWMTFASFAAGIAAVGLVLWQRIRRGVADCDLALAALCGLAPHGYFLLCGLFSIATPRYTYAMLSMAAFCGTLSARWALRRVGGWRHAWSSARRGSPDDSHSLPQ